MAAKRFTKSSIDWAALFERVPANQKNNLIAFRGRSENYMRKMNMYPEQAPKINWDMFKSSLTVPVFADKMKQQYDAVKVPYPVDNVSKMVDAQEKEAEKETVVFIQQSNERIKVYEKELAIWADMFPIEMFTEEDLLDAFPQLAVNPEKPSIYPHEPQFQPGYVDKELAAEHH